jgi:hypothetical protein
MGRRRGRKHKLRYELQSVRDKSFENRLRHMVRHQFGVCEAETVTVVAACLDYLRAVRADDREPFDVSADVPAGRDLRLKVDPRQVECREVTLSPCVEHDLDIWLEFGVKVMQSARAVRLVEQADAAGCTMPLSLLVSLVHLSSRTITRRLAPLWERGLRLPVLGIPASMGGADSRLAAVLRSYLADEPANETRREFLLSPSAYGQLLRTATWVVKAYTAGQSSEELVEAMGLSPNEVESTLQVVQEAEESDKTKARLGGLVEAELGPDNSGLLVGGISAVQCRRGFEAYLIRRHCFSPARAELLRKALEEASRSRDGLDRKRGDVVYWAIGDQEPAGKPRTDCELVATVLTFYDTKQDRVARGTSTKLKVRKTARLAAEARRQGGLLSLPDLAFLVAMGTNSLQQSIGRSGIFVPTRGAIMDIGRGVTHRAKIVGLYVEGYTETQIVRRTHHSYDAVASYIEEFCRVMLLCDRGLPPSHIRKVLGRSLKLVNEYIDLYRQLDLPDHQWKLNLMRRAAVAQEKKRSRLS